VKSLEVFRSLEETTCESISKYFWVIEASNFLQNAPIAGIGWNEQQYETLRKRVADTRSITPI
jgi:Tfp pilus assembly protein PilN